MRVLFDTNFLIWTATNAPRARDYPWLIKYQPWGVSPVSLLELQLLKEVGKITLGDEFVTRLGNDARYVIDEPPLLGLIEAARDLTFTRDPFDRLIAAHSEMRRAPLCTANQTLLEHHRYLARELRK